MGRGCGRGWGRGWESLLPGVEARQGEVRYGLLLLTTHYLGVEVVDARPPYYYLTYYLLVVLLTTLV